MMNSWWNTSEEASSKYGKRGNKFKKFEWKEVQSTFKITPAGSKYYVMIQQSSSHTLHRGMTQVITSFPHWKCHWLKTTSSGEKSIQELKVKLVCWLAFREDFGLREKPQIRSWLIETSKYLPLLLSIHLSVLTNMQHRVLTLEY